MRVRLSSEANRDFQQAAEYLIEHSPPAARMFADMLERAFGTLRRNPKIGRQTSQTDVRVLTELLPESRTLT